MGIGWEDRLFINQVSGCTQGWFSHCFPLITTRARMSLRFGSDTPQGSSLVKTQALAPICSRDCSYEINGGDFTGLA
ncbi:hypothetical protein LguiB_030518 [Lonicera macranthoides]